MLDIQFIRRHPEVVKNGLRKRNYAEADLQVVEDILAVDQHRRQTQQEMDALKAKSNKISKQIGQLFAQGKREEAESLKQEVAASKDRVKELEHTLSEASQQLEDLLLGVPNLPHETVPSGASDDDNEVVQEWEGSMPELYEGAVPHWDLVKQYNIIDFELGVKITGSGFPLYRGKGARLERALINFFLDQATEAGYEEILPPLLVNEATARGTGQIPDKEGQMYHAEKDDLYLIPTAEVPVTNIYRDVILSETDFPIKMTGYTPCFRREAGAYGKDVRGLNRVHQFNKVEIVQVSHPDKSYGILQEMLAHVEGLLKMLGLPYRILRLCGGDLGSASALTFDFEVYAAAQKRWLEVSSVSNFETYQTNRMRLRYRDADNKIHPAHTLNGSALALARIVAALLENNQTADGIVIPEVLQPYTHFSIIN